MRRLHHIEHIQSAWRLYNALQDFSRHIWETYDLDFLDHFFQEIVAEPPDGLEDHEDDQASIPF